MKRKKRRYVLKVRGARAAETKDRITAAILHLHREVGPRHTTVSAIAQRAGVERLTVYRHFPDARALFAACSRRHRELNPLPQPEAWAREPDPGLRTRRGLEEIYRHFSRAAPLYARAYADMDEFPALKKEMDAVGAHLRSLADALSAAWPPSVPHAARRRLVLRHAVGFATWQSLEELGVADRDKVELILEWVLAPALAPRPGPAEKRG